MSFRKVVLQGHLIGGFLSALMLICLGTSGGLLVFENEIRQALDPTLFKVEATGAPLPLNELVAQAEERHPGTKLSGHSIPPTPDSALTLNLRGIPPAKGIGIAVNQYTGVELGSLQSASQIPRQLHQFHTNFLLGPNGKTIAVVSSIFLVALSLSGLVLWWPWKICWFGPRPGRRALELHSFLGLYASVFMLLFGLTGIVIHWDNEIAAAMNRWDGRAETKPPALKAPVPPGAIRLDAERLIALAEAAVPGAHVNSLQNVNANAPVRITMKFPEDHTPAGRTNLFLEPVTGEVLMLQTSRSGGLGLRVAKLWNRMIHTGDLWGWPTRILAALMSFALPVLAVTGPFIWFSRRRRAQGSEASL